MIEKFNVLGLEVAALTIPLAIRTIDAWIDNNESHYVCVTPVHSVVLCQDDLKLKSVFNASGLITPDGMPLVWLGRLKGYSYMNRVYGPDLMLAVCKHSQKKGYRHFFYGGAERVPDLLVKNLKSWYPDLSIAGTFSPPFRSLSIKEDVKIVDMINRNAPDILWVGLGAPKQEYWMAEHIDLLNVPVLIGVGAAFDFHAGIKRQAPYWMQRSGLEWSFRLLSEPKRLWKRYIVSNPRFVALVLLQMLGLKNYRIV